MADIGLVGAARGGSSIPWQEQVRLSRRAHPMLTSVIGVRNDQLGNGERSPAPAANGKVPSNQPPNQTTPPDSAKQAMCTEQLDACEEKVLARTSPCSKKVLGFGLGLGAGCFPIAAASGPAAPETLTGCGSATLLATGGGLTACSAIRAVGILGCDEQFLRCNYGN